MTDNRYDLVCAKYGVSSSKPRHDVKCVAHADRNASLSIARGDKVDLLVHCHAGCTTEEIMDALCLPITVHEPHTPPVVSKIAAEYKYVDEDGATIAIKQRLEPKSFRWQSYDVAEGRMRSGAPSGGQALIPIYRLPAVREAAGKRLIFICEGEKDCDTLASLGAVATCNPEGASGAGSAYTTERWAALTRSHVVILPDNDDAGRKHAERVAATIYPMVASVRLVTLPEVVEKGDVTDYINAGGTLEELGALISATPTWTPSPVSIIAVEPILDPLRPRPLAMTDWEQEAQVMTQPITVVPTPFPTINDACKRGGGRQGWKLGWHIVLAGAPGHGKTTVALNVCVHAALKGKRVGIVSLEMGRDELMSIMLSIATNTNERELEAVPGQLNMTFLERSKLFQQMLEESGGAIYLVDLPRSDLMTVERAMRQMIEDGCELIMIDYGQRITVQGKADDYGRMTDVSNTVQGVAKQEKIVSLLLSQFNRGTSGGGYAPKAQGLKGSSAIEDDAGQIWLIDHNSYHRYPDDFEGRGPGALFMMNCGKNRYGPMLNVQMWMSHKTLQVTERTL